MIVGIQEVLTGVVIGRMKTCPRCGNTIEGTLNCPECGFKTDKKKLKDLNNLIKTDWSTDLVKVDNDNYKDNKISMNSRFDTWKI